MFVFSCLLLSLFLILERNKLIGMLHGLKKLGFFFPLQTHAKSQVMKGLQLRDRIPLSFVLLLRLLFTETVPVAFFGFRDVLFWGIVYLLSQKLVWIIPDPTCSTQTAPKKCQEGAYELFWATNIWIKCCPWTFRGLWVLVFREAYWSFKL